jgi:hypothetical protein
VNPLALIGCSWVAEAQLCLYTLGLLIAATRAPMNQSSALTNLRSDPDPLVPVICAVEWCGPSQLQPPRRAAAVFTPAVPAARSIECLHAASFAVVSSLQRREPRAARAVRRSLERKRPLHEACSRICWRAYLVRLISAASPVHIFSLGVAEAAPANAEGDDDDDDDDGL